MRVWFLVILAWCILPHRSDAQRYTASLYTEADGLLSSKVYDVVQDTAGLMWFTTRSGISGYDGLRFTNYSRADGLSSQSFSYLDLDAKGRLWAFPSSGYKSAFLFENGKWNHYNREATGAAGFDNYGCLEVFYQDGQPQIAVGTYENGLFVLSGKSWKHYNTLNNQRVKHISECVLYNNQLYVDTDRGLAILTDKGLTPAASLIRSLPDPDIKTLGIAKNSQSGESQLWILGGNWIGKLEKGEFSLEYQDSQPFSFGFLGNLFIMKTSKDELYFGNPVSLYQFILPQKKLTLLDRTAGLITDGATRAFEDREHNLWITSYRGITKIGTRQLRSYYAENGLFENEVTAITQIGPDNYAFGHYGAITRLQKGVFSHFVLEDSEKERKEKSRVLDLCHDDKGNLWAALSFTGLVRIDPKNKVHKIKLPLLKNAYVSSVIYTRDGRILAASSTQIYEIIGDNAIPVPTPGFLLSEIRKLFEGENGDLFIATRKKGLVHISSGKVQSIQLPSTPQANDVYSYCNCGNGLQLVGTTAGLFRVKGITLEQMPLGNQIINRPVFLILKDGGGRIWLGTDNGVYRWDGKRLDNFTVRYGMSGQEINRSGGLEDDHGHLWFGTNNGLTEYDPAFEIIHQQIPAPLVYITALKTSTDSLSLTAPLQLSSRQNDFVFHFKVISMLSEKENKYQYFLKGLHDTWSDPIPYFDPQIRFYDLKPGKYRLGIRACNSAGIWSEAVWTPEIRVMYPFYLRWWFITGFVIALILFIIMVVHYLTMSRYNVRLEKTVSERTLLLQQSEEKLLESNKSKDKFFSIIAHDLKNPVTALNSMLELLNERYDEFTEADKKRILGNLKSSSDQTIDLLDNLLTWARSQKGVLPFQASIFNLDDVILENIQLLKLHAGTKQIRIVFQENSACQVYADRNMISLVVRNLLSNAIKFTFSKGIITIQTRCEPDYCLCSITDSGRGMSEQSVQQLFKIEEIKASKGTEGERGTGLGLILCHDFLKKNGGSIEVTSQEAKGSTFSFRVPVANTAG